MPACSDFHPRRSFRRLRRSTVDRIQKRLSVGASGRRIVGPTARGRYTEPALTRSDLIAELAASNPHLRIADAELIVVTIFDQIATALARGERVELRGFGAFRVKQRNARIARNPMTGETVQVDEKAVPFFKTGNKLRVRLNRGGMKRRT